MEILQDIQNKIQLKTKQIQRAMNYETRQKYQNQLAILQLKKEIELLKNRIKQKINQQ
jgi:hypothetical protein